MGHTDAGGLVGKGGFSNSVSKLKNFIVYLLTSRHLLSQIQQWKH